MACSKILALLCTQITIAQANEFLKVPASNALSESVSEEDVRISLLDEVEGSLGKGSTSSRIAAIESALRPIVAALPKNRHSNLEHSAVSYALHRLFVLRHGWVIKGLGTEAFALHATSPTKVLKDQVPAFIERMFEQRLAGKGFGLHELAVLAATIEHLIHNEAVSKLGAVFNVRKLPITSPITSVEASEVLDTYMMSYILGENVSNMTLEAVDALNLAMPQVFLAWDDTQKFVSNIRNDIIKEDAAGSNLEFASMAAVVEAVGEHFGTFQDLECKRMKDTLVSMEYRGTGRVRLADFYRPALEGAWSFQESASYLRSLGALDETDPAAPSVIMANYITSHSNCIASSGFYSVCCKNECEGLLGHLEENIGAPEAKPEMISAVMSNMPSPTVTKVSVSLLERLDKIAAAHSGSVPLHSRLFAQWMHHVYPRECPYPHITGTIDSRQAPDEFMETTGLGGTATASEMEQHVSSADRVDAELAKEDAAVEDVMPWSTEEELIVANPGGSHGPSLVTSSVRSLVLLAASGSMAFAMIQGFSKSLHTALGNEKYTV